MLPACCLYKMFTVTSENSATSFVVSLPHASSVEVNKNTMQPLGKPCPWLLFPSHLLTNLKLTVRKVPREAIYPLYGLFFGFSHSCVKINAKKLREVVLTFDLGIFNYQV